MQSINVLLISGGTTQLFKLLEYDKSALHHKNYYEKKKVKKKESITKNVIDAGVVY